MMYNMPEQDTMEQYKIEQKIQDWVEQDQEGCDKIRYNRITQDRQDRKGPDRIQENEIVWDKIEQD